jgi:hydrogenase maturation factor HypF (carbamoyltransferase family)
MKMDAKYEWEQEQENAFQTLKQKLMSQPILQYHMSEDFILTTDASKEGAVTTLSQGETSKDRPVAHASRSFSKAEKSNSIVEKGFAAIVWGITYCDVFTGYSDTNLPRVRVSATSN